MTSPLNSCQTLRFSTDPPEFKIDYFEGKKKKIQPNEYRGCYLFCLIFVLMSVKT